GSNIGRTHTDRLAFVQETGVNLTYKMTDCVQLTVGYTFLYWNHVYRSGNQIDRSINPALNPAFSVVVPPGGPQQPQRLNSETSFWAEGINRGFRVTFWAGAGEGRCMGVFDQASRFTIKGGPPGFFRWLAARFAERFAFRDWVDARTVAFPGEPDRT